MMLSFDSRIAGSRTLPCGCGGEFAEVREDGATIGSVVAVHTSPGVIWQARHDGPPTSPRPAGQGYPIITGLVIGDESGAPVLFPRLGTFTVHCAIHGLQGYPVVGHPSGAST